jgi:hypothetical protein
VIIVALALTASVTTALVVLIKAATPPLPQEAAN